jgi:hypothetical protein
VSTCKQRAPSMRRRSEHLHAAGAQYEARRSRTESLSARSPPPVAEIEPATPLTEALMRANSVPISVGKRAR